MCGPRSTQPVPQLPVQAKYKKEHGSEPKYERIPHWDRSLLALQGPAAHDALRTLVPSSFNLDKFYFGQFATTSLKGIPAWVTRRGVSAATADSCLKCCGCGHRTNF